MAGVKGRSGGPRKNAGGARPGAGRPPKPAATVASDTDMLTLLQRIARGEVDATAVQVKAAAAAIPYTHSKLGEGGKKEQKKTAAKGAAAGGRFQSAPPPRQRVN